MTVSVNRVAVREFVTTIVTQAKAALEGVGKPGFLQMSRLHPTDERLVPSRYTFDDGERIISDAIANCEAGHNVYIEARTIREDAALGNGRGELKDTAHVFALVIDSDADTGKSWKPNETASPSMVVETSPGNFQYWFFFDKAIGADIGQNLGKGLRAATITDQDTGVVTQPYRVAGTVNYPNKTKIERGRVIVPTQLVDFNPETLWTQEQFARAFPKPTSTENRGADDPAASQPDEAAIPVDTIRVIRDGVPDGLRSHAFWNVIVALKQRGFTVDAIVALLEQYPNGIALKYTGRLRHEVERACDKIRSSQPPPPEPDPQPGPKSIITSHTLAELKDRKFMPLKWITRRYFPEGCTLFAGKPKIGKSWLMLSTAIAAALGGRVLDEQCEKCDVLYCALEDTPRRMKARTETIMCGQADWPDNVHVHYELPTIDRGGIERLQELIDAHKTLGLIIIDTLAKFRGQRQKNEEQYQCDYRTMSALLDLSRRTGIAIIVVHHVRKLTAEDIFDTISGTMGLSGAADTLVILTRAENDLRLCVRGRDCEPEDKTVDFDSDLGVWTVTGDYEGKDADTAPDSGRLILSVLSTAKYSMRPDDIAKQTGVAPSTIRSRLRRMAKKGQIERTAYGTYVSRT